MINTKKLMDRVFRRVSGVVWDVMSGKIGLRTENGIYTVDIAEDGTPTVSLNPLESLGVAIPAFATQSALVDVQPGDIVVGENGILGWAVSKTEAAVKLVDHNGHNKTYSPVKVQVLNTPSLMVVRNLFSLTGGASGAAGFASNLLPLLALGGDDSKLEKLLPLLLMSNGAFGGAAPGNGTGAANPMANMLPLLLLSGEGGLKLGGGGALEKMMLFQAVAGGGLTGAGGMNPMMLALLAGDGDLFGSVSSDAPPLRPVQRSGVPVLNPIR